MIESLSIPSNADKGWAGNRPRRCQQVLFLLTKQVMSISTLYNADIILSGDGYRLPH